MVQKRKIHVTETDILLIMTIIALLIPIFALIILTFYIFLEKKALYKNFEILINQTKEDAKIKYYRWRKLEK